MIRFAQKSMLFLFLLLPGVFFLGAKIIEHERSFSAQVESFASSSTEAFLAGKNYDKLKKSCVKLHGEIPEIENLCKDFDQLLAEDITTNTKRKKFGAAATLCDRYQFGDHSLAACQSLDRTLAETVKQCMSQNDSGTAELICRLKAAAGNTTVFPHLNTTCAAPWEAVTRPMNEQLTCEINQNSRLPVRPRPAMVTMNIGKISGILKLFKGRFHLLLKSLGYYLAAGLVVILSAYLLALLIEYDFSMSTRFCTLLHTLFGAAIVTVASQRVSPALLAALTCLLAIWAVRDIRADKRMGRRLYRLIRHGGRWLANFLDSVPAIIWVLASFFFAYLLREKHSDLYYLVICLSYSLALFIVFFKQDCMRINELKNSDVLNGERFAGRGNVTLIIRMTRFRFVKLLLVKQLVYALTFLILFDYSIAYVHSAIAQPDTFISLSAQAATLYHANQGSASVYHSIYTSFYWAVFWLHTLVVYSSNLILLMTGGVRLEQ